MITSGYIYGARTNQGGIRNVYISSEFLPTTDMTFTYGIGSQSNTITAIGGVTQSFYTFTQRIGQGSYVATAEQNIDNGTSGFTHVADITIENPTNILWNTINILLQNQARIIVLDMLGNFWMVGVTNGCYVTAGGGGPHKGYMDGNKVTLTFTSQEPLGCTLITAAAAASVIE